MCRRPGDGPAEALTQLPSWFNPFNWRNGLPLGFSHLVQFKHTRGVRLKITTVRPYYGREAPAETATMRRDSAASTRVVPGRVL
jgi:hypothetical protein